MTVTVRSRLRYDGTEPETVTAAAAGTLCRTPEGLRLSYQEPPETGLDGCRTTLLIRPDRVLLLRRGSVRSRLVFQEGLCHRDRYETPGGTLPLTVTTRRLRCRLDAAGGLLDIVYTLTLSGLSGESRLQLRIRR